MAVDLLDLSKDTASEPVDLLAGEPKSTATLSEPPVQKAVTYIPDKNMSVSHPVDASHDTINDAIQTQIYGRPRNLSFALEPNYSVVGKAADIVMSNLINKEIKLPQEAAKAGIRMVESVPKGIGALLDMMGQNGIEQAKLVDPEYQTNLAYTISKGIKDIGENAYQFYKNREETGFEKPDPEIFRGDFMSNPSVTRLVAGVIQNVPIVAATALASASTGGAAPLALFGAMATGEGYEASKEQGADTQTASLVGVGTGIGNTVLMSLPIGKAIAKLGMPPAASEAASFATLGALMTPFNNLMAKLGGDKTRRLADGMTESLLTMALSGYILGSFAPKGAKAHDEAVQDATTAGATPAEIDAARAAIASQIIDNSEAVNAALLEKMKPVEFAAPSSENEPPYQKFMRDVKAKYGDANEFETPEGVKVVLPTDIVSPNGKGLFHRAYNDEPNVMYIDSIESSNRGKGNASKVLDDLISIADKHGVELRLFPEKMKGSSLSYADTRAWYERRGFVAMNDGETDGMMRRPAAEDTSFDTSKYEPLESNEAAGVAEPVKLEDRPLSPKEELAKRDYEDAQQTIISYEGKKEFIDAVGKLKKPKDGFLKEELSGIDKSFFSRSAKAESIDEVADRLGLSSDELIQKLQEASVGLKESKRNYESALETIKELERQAVEAGRQYVKNEPFQFSLGKNDKTTAENIRNEKVGIERAQVTRGNQLVADIKREVPNPVERQGMFWYKAADGDLNVIKEALNTEEMAPYKDQLEAALKLSPEAIAALDKINRYYKEAGDVSQEVGSIKALRENYQNRIYKPEKAQDFVSSEANRGLRQGSRHGLRRYYESEFEAAQAGKEFATTDIADALAIHNEEMARVNTARKLTEAVVKQGLAAWRRPSNVPDDWVQVGNLRKEVPLQKDGEVVLDEDGNQAYASSVLVAPKGIAKGLEAVTDPNFINKIETLRGLAKFQGWVKSANVALGWFHDWAILKSNFYNRGFQDLMNLQKLDAKFSEANQQEREQDFVRHTGTLSISSQNIDILKSFIETEPGMLKDVENLPAIKALLDLPEKHAQHLFGKVMRFLKTEHYTSLVNNWIAENPEASNEAVKAAKIGFAKHINAVYGGLNWEALGLSKTHVGLLRLGLFAPDWTLSKIQLVQQAIGDGGTAVSASRGYLLRAAIAGMVLTEGLNKILTGHFTNDNEKGHFLEVEVSPGVHVSMLPGVVEDIANIGERVMTGGVSGIGAFARGKLSPAFRLGAGLASQTKYSGAPIVDRKHRGDPFSSTYDYLKFIFQSVAPVPFALDTLGTYLSESDKKSVPGALAIAAGISRFSKQPAGRKDSLI